MYKSIIAVALLATGSIGFANTSTPDTEAKLTPTNTFTSVRNLPVIVKNEMIATNLCRISFENGTSLDVPCDAGSPLPETVAAK